MSTKGVISRHLEELMKAQTTIVNKSKSLSTEKVNQPPKPSSPPRLYFSPDTCQIPPNPGSARIHPTGKAKTQQLPELSLAWQAPGKTILDLDFPIESPSSLESKICQFYKGGSRVVWLRSVNQSSKQGQIHLIKEILYNRDKYLKGKKSIRARLKSFAQQCNKERSPSPKPPFISSSKVPLSKSKHKSCIESSQKRQICSKLEELRCEIKIEENEVNVTLIRTFFLVLSLNAALNSSKKEAILTGIQERNKNLEAVALKKWKEQIEKMIEKKEFLRLLIESMNWWRTCRIFFAFRDYKSRKERKEIRVKHLSVILNFKKMKRLLTSWKNLGLYLRIEALESEIGSYLHRSKLYLSFIYTLKIPSDAKGLNSGRGLILATARKKLSHWHQLLRVLDKSQSDLDLFFSDQSVFNSVFLNLIKSLGPYKGLLERTRKPLYPSSQLLQKPLAPSEPLKKFTSTVKVHNATLSTNMFTLSFANFQTNEPAASLVPEGFIIGSAAPLNKEGLLALLSNLIVFWRNLKKISLSFHLQKAVEITKDLKGSLEKVSEKQYEIKVVSRFYQNWKKKFCARWVVRVAGNLRSLRICKKYFVATRAWRKASVKGLGEGEARDMMVKEKRAENFCRNRMKVRWFFRLKEKVGRDVGVKRIFKFCQKFMVVNGFLFWKHLSNTYELSRNKRNLSNEETTYINKSHQKAGLSKKDIKSPVKESTENFKDEIEVNEIDLDWDKFEEFKGWKKNDKLAKTFDKSKIKKSKEGKKEMQKESAPTGKTLKKEVRFQDEKLNTSPALQAKPTKPKEKKSPKPTKASKKPGPRSKSPESSPNTFLQTKKSLAPAAALTSIPEASPQTHPPKQPTNSNPPTQEPIYSPNPDPDPDPDPILPPNPHSNTNPRSNTNPQLQLADRYRRVLLLKKSMCGFIVRSTQHALKLYYKSLKSKKFIQIKSRNLLKSTFDSLLSYSLLSKR